MTNTKTTTTKKPVSKKAQAIKIVKRMNNRKNAPTRAEVINTLVDKVGLSPNGAATYFQNVKTGKWS